MTKTNKLDINLITSHLTNSALIPNKIVLSNRKSIAIIITDEGELVVRAPKNVQEKRLYDFLNEKSDWIIKKRKESSCNHIPKLKLDGSNEAILILGESYDIELSNEVKSVKLLETRILIPRKNSEMKLKSYIVKFAKKYIVKRVKDIADHFKLTYKNVSIRSSITRWGSCGYKNSLNFTYKLIMCPARVVDYIIVHELSHTIEKNHGARFYALVKKMMPDYKRAEQWLKTNKSIIHVI